MRLPFWPGRTTRALRCIYDALIQIRERIDAMSTPNKDALVTELGKLIDQFKADKATIASLTAENADLKAKVESLSAEDSELPAITQTITDTLNAPAS